MRRSAFLELLLNMIGYDWSWNGVDPEPVFRHVPDGLRHLYTTEEPPQIAEWEEPASR